MVILLKAIDGYFIINYCWIFYVMKGEERTKQKQPTSMY
jgi:hypothetical protein